MARTVLVVGGGLTGLRCAGVLNEADVDFQLLEADSCLGGRVHTEERDGFLLDRGFQVLLTGYPEARDVFDYGALDLRSFHPGARTYDHDGNDQRLTNPLRKPFAALKDVLTGLPAEVSDYPNLLRLFSLARNPSEASTQARTTEEFLRNQGISEGLIETFFRPFFGGVLLDRSLEAAPEYFLFLLNQFATSTVTVPNKGMERLVDQLAEPLPADRLRTNAPVESVSENQVTLASGETLNGEVVVVACDDHRPEESDRERSDSYRSCRTLYFCAESPPLEEPVLCLNGTPEGLVNNLTVMSRVAPGYAPEGRDLISVTVVGSGDPPEPLTGQVRAELRGWFGDEVSGWEHLETMTIDRALPVDAQCQPNFGSGYEQSKGVFYCGDHLTTPSINGALRSGRECAQAIKKQGS